MTPDVRMLVPGVGVGKRGTCRGCAAEIWWAKQPKTGKSHPYNADGSSHFSNCPKADDFRSKKAKA